TTICGAGAADALSANASVAKPSAAERRRMAIPLGFLLMERHEARIAIGRMFVRLAEPAPNPKVTAKPAKLRRDEFSHRCVRNTTISLMGRLRVCPLILQGQRPSLLSFGTSRCERLTESLAGSDSIQCHHETLAPAGLV